MISCRFGFFSCKGNNLTMHSMEKKRKWLAGSSSNQQNFCMKKTNVFTIHFQLWFLLKAENRIPEHSAYQQPCLVTWKTSIYFCYFDLSCSLELNKCSLVYESNIWVKNSHFLCIQKPPMIHRKLSKRFSFLFF